KIYYWLAGEVMEEGEAEMLEPPEGIAESQAASAERQALNAQFMTDVRAIKKNHITITPLKSNLTAYTTLDFIDRWKATTM
ncbi:MAG: 5'/3'-nucleotidase SurE, partial [Cyanobacteria bacterium J06631_12]